MRTKPPYAVTYRGGDGTSTKRFRTLPQVQEYIKQRWPGLDYVRAPHIITSDSYNAQWELTGCTIYDLGNRKSFNPEDDGWWDWEWKSFDPPAKSFAEFQTEGGD